MWTITLPLRVMIGKTKFFTLNLNQYRNEQFFNLNKSKIEYKRLITPLLKDIPKLKGCTLEYVLFPGSRTLCDVANVCSIHDKYFSDALVEAGKLEDDNYNFVPETHYRFGQIDKINPRVEVTITPMNQEQDMRIIITEVEIKEAIQLFITDQITINEGQEIIVDINATRGAEGFTANIDIVSKAEEPAPVSTTAATAAAGEGVVRRRGRPPGSVNKPKEDTAPAAEEAPTPLEEAIEAAPAPVAEAEVVQQPADAVAENLSEDIAQTEAVPAVTETLPEPEAAAIEAAPPAGVAEEVEQAPAPRQSLFTNLRRPVNEPTNNPVHGAEG